MLPSILLLAVAPALVPCLDHADHGRIEQARNCYLNAARSTNDPRVLAEVAWKLGDKKRANESFKSAFAQFPKDADLRVSWGRLFLDTYNRPEAQKLFKEALELDPKHAGAYLGLGLVAAEGFESAAVEHAKKALEIDPNLTEAHTLLASLALEEDDPQKASEHLDRALATKGSPLEAYALKTALDLLAGRSDSPWIRKALDYNPRYGRVYALPAHFFVITRRYQEAVDLYRKAIQLDPELWDAHAQLGVNLWRLGNEAEARRHLEAAYRADPFSAVTVNSLRLMDSLKRFQTFSSPNMVLKLHEKEADLLRPYVEELLGKAIDTYTKKYNFQPARPVQLEVYPDHEDFAVRTMGTPGLGALGVTFGYVVAMDSPSGRAPGSFHWGSTLWHELSHVFVLGMTNHKAPRWLSEGIAVYEELVAAEGWGDRVTPDVIKAVRDKRLLPIVELDRGFLRPRYPSQVPVSYWQAGLVCDLIAEKWGFPKLLDMLRAYTVGRNTEQVVREQLGMAPADFDKMFLDLVQSRLGKVVTSFDSEWRINMEQALKMAKAKKYDEVLTPARRARELYPDYVESGNAYELLAEAHLAKSDKAAAARELDQYRLHGGKSPRSLKQLASLLAELGQADKARAVLEQLLWIRPGDEELHTRLGGLLLEARRPRQAIREFNSLLAMKPIDPAGAHYSLARAYHQLNDREKTREHLLAALEAAPGYRPAQKLLLEINR
jgi:tetratricopeptide (TPR) repeat protein